MTTITNAVPKTVLLGIQDLSQRTVPNAPEQLPTHLPKIYIFAEEGPVTPQLVVGDSRTLMYGANSFDPLSDYYNHATVLANVVNAKGNAAMIQRVVPPDAAPPATLRIWMDVLQTNITNWQRNTDGSYKTDVNGNKIQVVGDKATIPGFKVKFVTEQIDVLEDGSDGFGKAETKVGDQVDGNSTQSTRYPILDARVPSFGKKGNNKGMRLYATTIDDANPVDQRIIENEKTYMYQGSMLTRSTDTATGQLVATLTGNTSVPFSLKPKAMDRDFTERIYGGSIFIQKYQNLMSTDSPPQWGPFGEFKLYDSQIKEVHDLLYAAEIAYKDQFPGGTDFDGSDDEQYRYNIMSGVSSYNVPYFTYESVLGNGVKLSSASTLWASGGTDGTMNNTVFDTLVAEDVVKYADRNDPLAANMPLYPESIIYDSGFGVATKKKLASFIAVRKDTFVVLGTHVAGQAALTADQESSLAVSLRATLQLYPESSVFGTSTCRAMIIGRSGVLLSGETDERMPLTIELASKAAAYMGASDGKWKSGAIFDKLPGAGIELFTDINVTVTSDLTKNNDWKNGLNWVENYTRKSVSWPALKTVYDNDTSVLNSFFNVMACVEIQKVADRVRRDFSGDISLTPAELVQNVNQAFIDRTAKRFDGKVNIVPETTMTGDDATRGYSWTSVVKVGANNMHTVEQFSIQSMRNEDLQT